jgi:hypothetical protein
MGKSRMIDLQEIEKQSRIAAIEICDVSGIKYPSDCGAIEDISSEDW